MKTTYNQWKFATFQEKKITTDGVFLPGIALSKESDTCNDIT